MPCGGHGATEEFTIPVGGQWHLFPKAFWDQSVRERQLASLRDLFSARKAPDEAQQLLTEIASKAFEMDMECLAFNNHKGSSQVSPCCQVVCRKCCRATKPMRPFEWVHQHKEWTLCPKKMLVFAKRLHTILEPLMPPRESPRGQIALQQRRPELQPYFDCYFNNLRMQKQGEGVCC